jgi:hypothetical protein
MRNASRCIKDALDAEKFFMVVSPALPKRFYDTEGAFDGEYRKNGKT